MSDPGRPGSGPIRFKTTFTNTIYEVMKMRGWKETNSDSDWDFIWAERYDMMNNKRVYTTSTYCKRDVLHVRCVACAYSICMIVNTRIHSFPVRTIHTTRNSYVRSGAHTQQFLVRGTYTAGFVLLYEYVYTYSSRYASR